jgi:hypothetical protein
MIMAVCTFGAASGFLPMASIALPAIQPIASAGAKAPAPIAMAAAKDFIISGVILVIQSSTLKFQIIENRQLDLND